MKHQLLFVATVLLLWAGAVACANDDEGPTPFRNFQVDKLLATDTVKTWLLVSRTENGTAITIDTCLSDNVLLFYQNTDTDGSDSNTFVLNSLTTHCIDTVSNDTVYTINQGDWEVPEEDFLPNADTLVMYLTDADRNTLDTSYRFLEQLTSQILRFSYNEVVVLADSTADTVAVVEEFTAQDF